MSVIYVCPKCETEVTDENYSHDCPVDFKVQGRDVITLVRTVYRPRVKKNKQLTEKGYMKWAGSRPNQVATEQ